MPEFPLICQTAGSLLLIYPDVLTHMELKMTMQLPKTNNVSPAFRIGI